MKRTVTGLALAICVLFAAPKTYAQLSIGIGISVTIAPPALPVYVQPACPSDGFIWTPGYWAYDNVDGYYWVPGVWVAAPQPGYLWTPSYWGYDGGHYGWHEGYWGEHVGFYGGINYGFGYGGDGYGGGRWQGGHFQYNTAISNVNVTVIHNTYVDKTVIINNNTHTSFNGQGGVTARPRPEELQAEKEHHIPATTEQSSHQQTASKDRNQFANVNHGKPTVAAMNKVGGTRYTPQGHNAPAPQPRQATAAKKPVATPQAHANTTAAAPKPAARPQTRTNATAAAKRTTPTKPVEHQQKPTVSAKPQTHTTTHAASTVSHKAPAKQPTPQKQVTRAKAPVSHPVAAKPATPKPQQHPAAQHAPQPVAKSKPPVEKHS